MSSEIRFEKIVHSSQENSYRMFTNAVGLQEWLCNRAIAQAHPRGLFYAGWNEGYYASGEYQELIPNQLVVFSWQGKNEPGKTQVKVTFETVEHGVKIELIHHGFGNGDEWQRACQEIEKGWQTGLENLVSTLQTGEDLRIVNRPMLGVLFGNFDEIIAKKLGVPVSKGLRLEDTVEGLGARKAGLLKNDVLTEMNGVPLSDFGDTTQALKGKIAGDVVSVKYFRGEEQRQAEMQLSRRPLPQMPEDSKQFAFMLSQLNQEDEKLLAKALEGVTEDEASYKTEVNEWSVKEILAHLIQGARMTQHYLVAVVASQGNPEDMFPDNNNAYIHATVASYGSMKALMDEYMRCNAETVLLLEGLPNSFVAQKSSFWRMAYFQLSFPVHGRSHAEQIQAVVRASRAKAKA